MLPAHNIINKPDLQCSACFQGGDNIKTSIIILAAGFSERMGVFKPLLQVGGRPAVLRSVYTAKDSGVNDIIVVTGHMCEDIETVLSGEAPEVRIVRNSRFHEGMFSSVYAGVSALPEDLEGFFILPADCCAVSPGTLLVLMEEIGKTGESAVVYPVFEGRRGHPPLIPARFIDELLSYNGKDGLRGFLSLLPGIYVQTDDRGVLLDMDTPEEYATLLMFLGLSDDDSGDRGRGRR